MSDDIKYIDIEEFQSEGYLQEVNRCFLHPLGLAMAVGDDPQSGKKRVVGIWDYRDDPEGMFFHALDDDDAEVKAQTVANQRERLRAKRVEAVGDVVQPIGHTFVIEEDDEGAA